MSYLKSFILDTWAGLSHNAALGEGDLPPTGPDLAPTWIGKKHHRRLQAYRLLTAYRNNVARWHLHFGDDADAQRKHREYGDPELIVQQTRASLLGGRPRPLVDGAGLLRAEPTEADAELAGRPLTELKAEWEDEKKARPGAHARQRWFDAQYKVEHAARKIIACENNAVGLGDGIYHLAWSQAKQRVRLRVHDPGTYFDVWSDDDDDEFPSKVHLAWEEERDQPGGGTKTYVRRITHEMVRLDTPRRYPYARDVESWWTVLLTDATWALDDLKAKHVDDFAAERAVYGRNDQGQQLRDYDLHIDFLPLVHVPNTIPDAEGQSWGQSILVRIAQLLDDLARADTDLATTADLLGMPPIAVEGLVAPVGDDGEQATLTYEPGQVWGGKVTVVDTSRSLDALLKRCEALFERLSVNRQIPQSVLGRVNLDNGRLAGITLLLSFGPFRTLMEDLRLVREDKYRLLHKMWQRLAIAGGAFEPNADAPGALPPGSEVLETDIAFGPYLPTDVDGVKQLVIDLVLNHLISKATGLRLMVEAGLDVGDLDTEIRNARTEDFDSAETLANATGSEQAAIDRLELDIEPPEPPAAPAAAPVPGSGAPAGPGREGGREAEDQPPRTPRRPTNEP